jgi:Asp-tRNA(Asn)/Glu-tRNA(Gln) amidotransferase A subunit family amidase
VKPSLNRLSAVEAAHGLAQGEFTAEALTAACLERIAAREATVNAWAYFDPALAMRQARALDKGPRKGPLHGLPVAVKDVFDTYDMPTEMGSPIYRGYRPVADAAVVADARASGAVIMGKAVTAEFAGVTPGATSNPHNPAHTPGGSSSGSAAALADFMCPLAFGTQTGGSIVRPASFCGVVGFKPTYGSLNRVGLKVAAESLDTVGVMARSVDDVELFYAALTTGEAPKLNHLSSAPRVGLCRTPLWTLAQPETVEAIEDAADRLAQAGAKVREVTLPSDIKALADARDLISYYERLRAMADEWARRRDLISPKLKEGLTKAATTPREQYIAALGLMERCRAQMVPVFADVDILLTPAVPGEAPTGLSWTGDTRFQAFWTMLHLPTIALPTHRGPKGLPVGIQLVTAAQDDARLLDAARWVWGKLGGPEGG